MTTHKTPKGTEFSSVPFLFAVVEITGWRICCSAVVFDTKTTKYRGKNVLQQNISCCSTIFNPYMVIFILFTTALRHIRHQGENMKVRGRRKERSAMVFEGGLHNVLNLRLETV